jgi:hypothetical protein
MIVGNHELRGRVEKLAMPFVVMKNYHVIGGAHDEQLNVENGKTQTKEHNSVIDIEANRTIRTSYEVAAIIKKKIIFSEYPNAIIR